MRILAIETATARQSIALLEDERILARADHDAHAAHAKSLVPTVDRLLATAHVSLKDLQGLAVSIGPGSFTGLRVGLATMLGFRLVTGLPLVGVPTLEALAWNVPGDSHPICPMVKARAGEVYWAVYRWTGRPDAVRLECLMPARVDPIHRLAELLTEPVTVVGDGWLAYRHEIERQGDTHPPNREMSESWRQSFAEPPDQCLWPSAVSIGLAAYRRFACGEVAGASLTPLYVQRAEAEVVWESKQRKRTIPKMP